MIQIDTIQFHDDDSKILEIFFTKLPTAYSRTSLRVEPFNAVLEQETWESRKPKYYMILIVVIGFCLLILINGVIPLQVTEISQLFIEHLWRWGPHNVIMSLSLSLALFLSWARWETLVSFCQDRDQSHSKDVTIHPVFIPRNTEFH